ncbi:MAG: hypothetical protein DSY90_05140 [Deltaproteobacteria bacterium]|nr:MAG: hypothetical protein DSY90_05140 [Deltaproteobacteria bacterium]
MRGMIDGLCSRILPQGKRADIGAVEVKEACSFFIIPTKKVRPPHFACDGVGNQGSTGGCQAY